MTNLEKPILKKNGRVVDLEKNKTKLLQIVTY